MFKKSAEFKKSYSQCGEDLICDFIFKVKGVKTITYLDIGSHHPYLGNNTFLFSENGSKGVCIDAAERFESIYNSFRKEDEFIKAVFTGNNTSEEIEFYHLIPDTLSTSDSFVYHQLVLEKEAELRVIEKLKTINVSELLKKGKIFKDLNLLSIDIEGDIQNEISSFFEVGLFPKVVICETISYSNKNQGVKNQELIQLFLGNGYFLYADTYINSIFVLNSFWKS